MHLGLLNYKSKKRLITKVLKLLKVEEKLKKEKDIRGRPKIYFTFTSKIWLYGLAGKGYNLSLITAYLLRCKLIKKTRKNIFLTSLSCVINKKILKLTAQYLYSENKRHL